MNYLLLIAGLQGASNPRQGVFIEYKPTAQLGTTMPSALSLPHVRSRLPSNQSPNTASSPDDPNYTLKPTYLIAYVEKMFYLSKISPFSPKRFIFSCAISYRAMSFKGYQIINLSLNKQTQIS